MTKYQSEKLHIVTYANGTPGKDGSDIEYIYYRSSELVANWSGKGPNKDGSFKHTTDLKNNWTSSPQGVSETYLYEYMTYAKKQVGATDFDNFNSEPVIWSKWGEKGQDGDGVIYYYCQMSTEEIPQYPTPTDKEYQWYNDPKGVSETYPFEYVVTIATSAIEATAKKIDTEERLFSKEDWEKYGAVGHLENWTIRGNSSLNNSHIYIGDYAYVSGEVIEEKNGETVHTGLPAKIYGEVVELINPNQDGGSIRMKSVRLVFEGNYQVSLWAKWSKDGEDGESAYYIYHDKHDGEGMPSLPTEIDYTKIGTPESAGDNGWYTIQTSDSVYQTWKICKPSEQPTTNWGPVKRIDGTLTNYNDLWNALDEKSSQDNTYGGIYTIKDGEEKYIGIKADFIKTGALCVGDNPYYLEGENKGELNPEANNKFYADMSENGAVRIAGWFVSDDTISNAENFDNSTVGIHSGEVGLSSLLNEGGDSPIRFYGGCYEKTVVVEEKTTSGQQTFTYSPTDCLSILSAEYSCKNGGGGGSFSGIGTKTLSFTWSGSLEADLTITYTYKALPFAVLEDGSLHASNAKITGTIYADSGKFTGEIHATKGQFDYGTIGGLHVQEDCITSTNEESGLTFLPSGDITAKSLEVSDSLKVGKITGRINDPPYLDFEASGTATQTVKLIIKQTDLGSYTHIKVKTENNVALQTTHRIKLQLTYVALIGEAMSKEDYYVTIFGGGYHASTSAPREKQITYGGQEVTVQLYSVQFTTGDTYTITETYSLGGLIGSNSSFIPIKTNLTLGTDGNAWAKAFLSDTNHSSDRKIKDNIFDIPLDFSEQLINGLKPKSYTFKTAKTPRKRYGFIAQDVEKLLYSLGTSADEVGLVCKSKPGESDSENNHYSLNYINLIAPMVSVIQQLSKRVEGLENKLNTIQNGWVIKT